MRLTATDIRQQQFAMKLIRGFDPQEVDAFLEELADDVEELTRENALLKEQLAALEERTRGMDAREQSLHETLVTAQKIAEEFRENSRRESDLILRDAQLRAEKLLQDSRAEHAQLASEVGALRRERRRMGEEILRILESYRRLVEQDLAADQASAEAAEPARPAGRRAAEPAPGAARPERGA
jgi:cell division initiation protein